ncbi:MAG TPA: alpha-amylase family glycosyl hydrolase [Mobilitalea sp.]|nr:alpha-amylase family glycosyl hydrolase [Mobilitalea sp.]
MKKRLMGFLLCFVLLLTMLSGCAKNTTNKSTDSGQGNQNQSSPTITPTPAITAGTANGQTGTEVSYQYQQDLNIIDDNYRNYYEIFVYSYCDSNGDGIGDFNGITSKLDYISNMGFNGIWLMPIMPSPSYHKYDTTDYNTVDPSYGTIEDFQNLINECHKRGIKLIIDYVFNHTSSKHPWFTQAVDYLETLGKDQEPDLSVCPYVGYYHFVKDKKGSDYYKTGSSDYYYEAVFWDQMPDLALESKELRAEIEKNAKFWLDMGVDGFRLDAVKEYFSGETSKNVEVLQWFTDYVKSIKADAYIVGECWDSASTIASYYKSGITSIFNYPLALYNGIITTSVRKLGTSNAKTFANNIMNLQKIYSESNPGYIDAPFISNHDNTRISAQCVNDENTMKMDAGILLTLNGSPFVYYGEEIGMNSMGNNDANKRLPMNWSTTDTTGITKAPPGADNVVQKFAPLDEQQKDPLSIANYYKLALRIRNENPEIARGELSMVDSLLTNDVCVFKKVYNGSEIVIVYNMNKEAATVDLKSAGLDNLGIRGYLTVDGSEVTLTDGVVNMPLYSIVILN